MKYRRIFIICIALAILIAGILLSENISTGKGFLASNTVSYASCTSASKDDITWTFDARPCGTYVTGDWWVQGPVIIRSITKPNGVGRDGSMVNPIPSYTAQGYDSRVNVYSGALDVSDDLPLTLTAGQSLVSTISRDPTLPATSTTARPALLKDAVLTVVASDPGANKFRPPFVGNAKPTFSADNLHWELLPSLNSVANTPTLAEMKRKFPGMPIIDHRLEWEGEFLHAAESMPNHYYGAHMSKEYGDAVLRLFINEGSPEDKETLLIRLIQIGIDHWGEVNSGAAWGNISGTMGVGRKFPIMFAGLMLNENSMKNIASIVNTRWIFQEDCQTFYLNQESINAAKTHYGVTDSNNVNPTYYDLPLGTAVWGERNCDWSVNDPYSWRQNPGKIAYDGITYGATEGEALAARLLNLVSLWNHQEFFDWHDRLHKINHWKEWGSAFATNMWNAYRGDGTVTPPQDPPTTTLPFAIGNKVKVTYSAGAPVRSSAEIINSPGEGNKLGIQPKDKTGVITGGSGTLANNTKWWNIDFDNSEIDGWSGEDNFIVTEVGTARVCKPWN